MVGADGDDAEARREHGAGRVPPPLRGSHPPPRSQITSRWSGRSPSRTAARSARLQPAKKFYPQEQAPIAYVDYRLGLKEDIYVVLGDFARDGSQATIKVQVNRLVSWIWIGGVVLTLGALLAILPDRRETA
jgi:cytochrome c biogenesis factor